jgi:isoquinoline 1-oxidoreductase beta subunit
MSGGVTRRALLVGGGVGAGLVVAWTAWPRRYAPNLVAEPGEHVYGAWLRIGEDGHIVVAVPQVEHGQGSWTALPQIVADELGADWRTVAVEPAPLNPVYANPLALDERFEGMFDHVPASVRAGWATRSTLMLTAASTGVRQFEDACRTAGAGARALLCKAAARRWNVGWETCSVDAGFVVHGKQRLRFADLAAEAVKEKLPDPLPIGVQGAGKAMGQSLPRLDTPAKVDGSANFAADIRLPDMVYVAVRAGPRADSWLVAVDRAAALRVRGVAEVVDGGDWVAVAAATGWAAERGLDALHPRFATDGAPLATDASIDAALAAALGRDGATMTATGKVDQVVAGPGPHPGLVTADYRVASAPHAAIETPAAAAAYRDGRLELWLATQAPEAACAAVAAATGLSAAAVVLHPMPIGGGFGAALEPDAAVQAAIVALKLKRPVSLQWSRGHSLMHDRCRPPARARLSARLAANGAILGWRTQVAAPSTGRELAHRLLPGAFTDAALLLDRGDAYAVAGAVPRYRLPAFALSHHAADIGVATGHLRGGAHGYTAFFTESFVDELAHVANSEAVSYRIGMLGGEPRLARCLSTAASLGGWDGGAPGSGQGIAAHAFRGSYVAVFAEAHVESGRPQVDRLVAAVDCGRLVNPDLVRQQVEGGLLFGLAQALGVATGNEGGLGSVRGFDRLDMPVLADTPDITVELIRSDEAPGGAGEIGVPAVAPAIANALATVTGRRWRSLPLA